MAHSPERLNLLREKCDLSEVTWSLVVSLKNQNFLPVYGDTSANEDNSFRNHIR